MKFWIGILIFIILLQTYFLVKMQRQIRDICRQLAFLMKHDSNMLITANMKTGGFEKLVSLLNDNGYAFLRSIYNIAEVHNNGKEQTE